MLFATEMYNHLHCECWWPYCVCIRFLIPSVSHPKLLHGRSRWSHGLRRGSATARYLWLWDWIPPVAWIFVSFDCCVLSSRGLCDELVTRPEESYRLWCVVLCDLVTWWMRRPWLTGGPSRQKQTNKQSCFMRWFVVVGQWLFLTLR